MKAIIHSPGEGTRYSIRGSTIVFKALGLETGGAFSFFEREMPPGVRMTPAHRHVGPEAFYVPEGTLEFHVDDTVLPGPAGTFLLVPEGVPHTFGNTSGAPARLLTIHAPAADAYFAEMHDLWSSPDAPTPDQEREVQRRHGLHTA